MSSADSDSSSVPSSPTTASSDLDSDFVPSESERPRPEAEVEPETSKLIVRFDIPDGPAGIKAIFVTDVLPAFFRNLMSIPQFTRHTPQLSEATMRSCFMSLANDWSIIAVNEGAGADVRQYVAVCDRPRALVELYLRLRAGEGTAGRAGAKLLPIGDGVTSMLCTHYMDKAGRPFGRHRVTSYLLSFPELFSQAGAVWAWLPVMLVFGSTAGRLMQDLVSEKVAVIQRDLPGITLPSGRHVPLTHLGIHDLGAAYQMYAKTTSPGAGRFPVPDKRGQVQVPRCFYRTSPCCNMQWISMAHAPQRPEAVSPAEAQEFRPYVDPATWARVAAPAPPPAPATAAADADTSGAAGPCRAIRACLTSGTVQPYAYGRHANVHVIPSPLADVAASMDRAGYRGAASVLEKCFRLSKAWYPCAFTQVRRWNTMLEEDAARRARGQEVPAAARPAAAGAAGAAAARPRARA